MRALNRAQSCMWLKCAVVKAGLLCSRLCPGLILLIAAMNLLAASSMAQLPPLPGLQPPETEPDDDLSKLYSERRVVKYLKDLTAAGRKKQGDEVRDLLNVLRAADPLLMVSDSRGVFIPLHRDLTMRLQNLKPAQLEQFQYENAAAEAALQRTLAQESYRGLIPFLHRYAGTRAALRAHLLLAVVHRDRGNSLAADFWLAPLLGSAVDPDIRAAAEKLNASLTSSEGPGGGQSTVSKNAATAASGLGPLPETVLAEADESISAAGAVDRVENPAVADSHGPASDEGTEILPDAAQSTVAGHQTTAQKHVHWTHSLPLPIGASKRSRDLVQGAAEYGILPWTAWAPEIDADRIYIRTPWLITAYDRTTGRHAWTRTLQQQQQLVEELDDDLPAFRMRLDEGGANSALNAPDIQLLHRNEIVGRMTSDADRIFAVCKSGETSVPSGREENFRLRAVMGQVDTVTAGTWELVAIEKATGRRLWTTGGPPVEEKFGNELAMSWFAGPPAVLGQVLYQVVERNGAIQMVCLKASTGQVRWTLPLAYPDIDIAQDPARQLLAAQIYANGGLLLTTTTTGWVFAIDSLTQSVQWARRLPVPAGSENRGRSFRNPAFLQTQLQPLGKVWRSQSPLVSPEALVIASAESHQLVVLDPRTGNIRLKASDFGGSKTHVGTSGQPALAVNATVVIYADQAQFIVASPAAIVSCRLSDLEKQWTVDRKVTDAVPVGPSVRSGDDLLVPLSDGSLEVIGFADGQVKTTLKGLRPPFSSGGLFSAGDDIISYGPNHLALLSSTPADRSTVTDALQQARFLLETGHVAEARTALTQVHLNPLNRESVRRLRFRIALGGMTAEASPNVSILEELESLAETPEEKALAQYLRLDYLLATAPDTLSQALINALTADDAVQQVEIPDASALRKILQTSTTENPLEFSSLDAGSETLRYPFRSWVQQQLRRQVALADPNRQAEIVRSCQQLADRDLLEMQSPELASEYLRRAEEQLTANRMSESTLQLLIAAADFHQKTRQSDSEGTSDLTARIAAAFDKAISVADDNPSHDATHRLLLQRLLRVVRYELSAAEGAALSMPEDISEQLAERWSKEPDTLLTMLPVSTTGQMAYRTPPVVPVDVALHSDPVLSAFHWSFRRTPGALLCQPVNDRATLPWTLKVSGSENAFLQSEEELYRFGSIIILQNMTGLSAFSVTDQRWLWTRPMPGIMGRRANRMLNRPFQDFRGTGEVPFLSNYGRRLCGGSHRWLCVVSEGTLEVLDVMTGNRLWAVNGLKLNSTAFVCQNAVCITGLDEATMVVNPVDGTPILPASVEQLPGLLRQTMLGSPEALVVWDPGTPAGKERAIKWVNPLTADVVHTVPLPGMEWAQFLDGETLAAVTGDQRCHILNLRTRDFSTFSFAGEGDSAATELQPQQIAVAADRLNYYVFERQENAMIMAGSMYGIRAEPVQKELRAVNRRTGTLAWMRRPQGNTMACIEGTESVMLILTVTAQPRANAAAIPGLALQAGQRYTIEGVSRSTGIRRLHYPVVSQIPFPSLRLSSTSTGLLDLEAFGNRVRFFEEPDAAMP